MGIASLDPSCMLLKRFGLGKAEMTIWRGYRTILAIAAIMTGTASAAHAEGKFKICHGGTLTLLSFNEHIAKLRTFRRYDRETIDNLVQAQRKGGPEFFSQQIAYQGEVSGSGTYDLRTWHGIYDSKNYLNVTTWTCDGEDYPIAYFIGFRVQEAADGVISVDRQKGIVNVISLKGVAATPDGPIKVKIAASDKDVDSDKTTDRSKVADSGKVICEDIAKACIPEVFYDNN